MKDDFGREITYLRLSVTDLCNLRCRYCMPADGICKKPHAAMLTEDEMIRAVETAAGLGVRKVRITGGEPLVKPNILSICERVAAVDGVDEVCLTTNGLLLPQMAHALRQAGVRRVNISLDTLDPAKYAHITRGGRLGDALAGLEAALAAGFTQVKVNAVLIGGFNENEIGNLAGLTKTYPTDVRFIELMPMTDSAEFGPDAYLPGTAVLDALPELRPVRHDGGVAKLYQLPGAKGCIGLISPVSAHFCAACNRMRLTADGVLKPCLHSPVGVPLKGLDDAGMRAAFLEAIRKKPAQHDPLSAVERSRAGRAMHQIGG